MKKWNAIGVMAVALVMVVACTSRKIDQQVLGAWKLVDIDCRINGEEDLSARENIGESYYVFAQDSTYVLTEDGEQEQGLWMCKDSLLGKRALDEADYVWHKIEVCTEDTLLISLPDDSTEYGVVTEKRLYVRQ